MSADIDFLRSLPSHPGPMGTVYVTIPKLARDWLCDRSELVDRLYDAQSVAGGVLTDQLASVREVAFQGPTDEELKAWRNTSLSMGDGMTAMLAMIVANVRAVLVSYEAQTAENAAP